MHQGGFSAATLLVFLFVGNLHKKSPEAVKNQEMCCGLWIFFFAANTALAPQSFVKLTFCHDFFLVILLIMSH